MDNHLSRADALVLMDRIRSPHLSFKRFSQSSRLYNIARRPFTTLPPESVDATEKEIATILKVVEAAITNLNPETFQAVLDLPYIKASSFGGQAFVRKFLRGNAKADDSVTLSKSLSDLRDTLAAP